jgi:hypothetical protein
MRRKENIGKKGKKEEREGKKKNLYILEKNTYKETKV